MTTAAAPDDLVTSLLLRHQKLAIQNIAGAVSAEDRARLVEDLVAAGVATPPGAWRDALRDILYFWAGDQTSRGERKRDAPLPALAPFVDKPAPLVASQVSATPSPYPSSSIEGPIANAMEGLAPMIACKMSSASGVTRALRSLAKRTVLPVSAASKEVLAAPATDIEKEARARAILRIAALARQWRVTADPDAKRGYLLNGKALTEASLYAEEDPDINAFVKASQGAEMAQKRRLRAYVMGGTTIFAMLVCIIGVLSWKFWYLERTKESYIFGLKSGNIDPTEALKWLDRYQIWLPPYELSGIPVLEGVTLPGLRLHAPNFADVSFKEMSWPRAQLAGASFAQSQFSFARDAGPNDLSGANLRQAQFRSAKIAFTSLVGADLYRAVFDRAMLCNVDFSGANLRSASFWAVTLNDETKKTLKNTAWWQAVGWPWSEIQGIAHANERDKTQRARLKASAGFGDDIQRAIRSLRIAEPNTPERALALNDIAWTRAVWGIDVSEGTEPPADAASQTPRSDPCLAEGVPVNARDAAERAVCIVRKLNSKGGAFAELLANLRDTLAYILMQSNQMSEALETFEEIRKDNPKFFETGGSLFRYAIAQYVAGPDKDVAIENFNIAILQKRYQPTHELQTLKDQIFSVKEFVGPLKASIEKLWPPVPNESACPAPKSTTEQ